ncbi:MAG: sugar phosphate isomerase/epimerase [Ruminococcaceae bacterium]|nr:sugar phosphate isomerase/epimerase [Oscillospiraceae bacterium]
MDFPIALQLFTVRDDMKNDFEGTLKTVKALGYDGVEFAGLFGKTSAQVKKMCEEIGLVPISAHIPFVDMIKHTDILNTYAEIGCKYVVIPYLTEEYRPGEDKFAEVIEGAKMLGEKAKSLGMMLCYHNHDFEFTKINGEYALDILYNEVSADLLQTELDTCWVNIGGEEPAAYIRKYSGRCEVVHLKDFVGGKAENMYGLIGIDENEKKDTGGKFEFRPVGYGVQNFPGILEAAKDAGALWMVVEQDQPSMDKTPIECAEMSINYLKSL